ncbi:MAG: tetratricopeptide repeat protein [Sneathiella sp.]|nr:tetratricopeptide repeat protein [Sneathiella sp.]
MSQMLYTKALQRYMGKNLSGAKNTCRRIKKSSDYFGHSTFLLGCIAKDEKQWNLAITQFNKSIAVKPDNFLLYRNLSEVYSHQGHYTKSMKASEKSLQLADTDDAKAHCLRQLGKIQYDLSRLDEAQDSFQKSIAFKPDVAVTHYFLGVILLQTLNAEKAVTSFRNAIELGIDTGGVYRDLGRAFIQTNMKAEAVSALEKSIELSGPDESTTHMINALTGQQTEAPPDKYIERLFDDVADNFEDQLITGLKYNVPARILALLQQKSLLQDRKSHILDIGCGTGLVGQILAPCCETLTGVDLSRKMLNIAKEKGVYSTLTKNNIINELQTTDLTAFDFIIGADVLIYMGNLMPFFETLGHTNPVKKSATVIFSLELSANEDYQLLPSGRYAHSERYIEHLCRDYGFRIELKDDTVIRTERGINVDGTIYFIQPRQSS